MGDGCGRLESMVIGIWDLDWRRREYRNVCMYLYGGGGLSGGFEV